MSNSWEDFKRRYNLSTGITKSPTSTAKKPESSWEQWLLDNIYTGVGQKPTAQNLTQQLQGSSSTDPNSDFGTAGGNIDLKKRPIVWNDDGTYSTVDSIGVTADGKIYLIPTIIKDKKGNWIHGSSDQAIDYFLRSKEYLGVFDNEKAAVDYANLLNDSQSDLYGKEALRQKTQRDSSMPMRHAEEVDSKSIYDILFQPEPIVESQDDIAKRFASNYDLSDPTSSSKFMADIVNEQQKQQNKKAMYDYALQSAQDNGLILKPEIRQEYKDEFNAYIDDKLRSSPMNSTKYSKTYESDIAKLHKIAEDVNYDVYKFAVAAKDAGYDDFLLDDPIFLNTEYQGMGEGVVNFLYGIRANVRTAGYGNPFDSQTKEIAKAQLESPFGAPDLVIPALVKLNADIMTAKDEQYAPVFDKIALEDQVRNGFYDASTQFATPFSKTVKQWIARPAGEIIAQTLIMQAITPFIKAGLGIETPTNSFVENAGKGFQKWLKSDTFKKFFKLSGTESMTDDVLKAAMNSEYDIVGVSMADDMIKWWDSNPGRAVREQQGLFPYTKAQLEALRPEMIQQFRDMWKYLRELPEGSIYDTMFKAPYGFTPEDVANPISTLENPPMPANPGGSNLSFIPTESDISVPTAQETVSGATTSAVLKPFESQIFPIIPQSTNTPMQAAPNDFQIVAANPVSAIIRTPAEYKANGWDAPRAWRDYTAKNNSQPPITAREFLTQYNAAPATKNISAPSTSQRTLQGKPQGIAQSGVNRNVNTIILNGGVPPGSPARALASGQNTDIVTMPTQPATLLKGGKSVEVTGISSVENGKVYVSTANGKPIALDHIVFKSGNMNEIYRAANTFDTPAAKTFVSSYAGKEPAGVYYAGFASIYNAAKKGLSLDNAIEISQYSRAISPTEQQAAYFAGQNAAGIKNTGSSVESVGQAELQKGSVTDSTFTDGSANGIIGNEGEMNDEGAGETSNRTFDFKKFQDKTEAQKWGINEYSTWKSGLSAEETSALSAYTGDDCYQNINAVLRGAESQYNGNNERIVQQLSQALSKASVPRNVTLFRGASKIMLGKYINLPPEKLIGKVISDKAFMSTSLVDEGAFDADLTLVIETPEGAQGAYIGNLSYYPDEVEVLLNKGQQMVIKNVLDAGTPNMKIVVELIP